MSRRFPSPKGIGYTRKTECEINGEHYGDVRPIRDDDEERTLWVWSCCQETEESEP